MSGSVSEADEAARLRNAMVDWWHTHWHPYPPDIEQAMRVVPRHLFLPGFALDVAYDESPVVTHRDDEGEALSSASQPICVADMLEQLDVRPGHRILEIGAGTGYNAALLAHLAGPGGSVTTIDIVEAVVEDARRHLATTGYERVRVISGDGEYGYRPGAPYDRIIVTGGAWDIPSAWLDQLAPGGRIVVPLRIRGLTRSVALEQVRLGVWRSVTSAPSGFIPLRGASWVPERDIPIDADGRVDLRVETSLPITAEAVRGAVLTAPVQRWTGVTATDAYDQDLDYWLAIVGPLGRVIVRRAGHEIVTPARQGGGMAAVTSDSFAYLTARDGGDGRSELGVCGYGPSGGRLADQITEQLIGWAEARKAQATPCVEVYATGVAAPEDGLLLEDKRHTRVVVRA
jgi:protein-L-isoaspartate(D-aspartate) O-methyltransferase